MNFLVLGIFSTYFMDLVCNPSCKSNTDIWWSFTIYLKYNGSFKGAHSNFFSSRRIYWGEQIRRRRRRLRQQKRQYFRNDFSEFVLNLVAIISTRLKCQMLADYDLRKNSHKRFHLVVSRAVTTKNVQNSVRTCSFDVAVAVAVAVVVAQTGSIVLTAPPPPPHSGHLPTIDLKMVGIRSRSQSLLIDDGDGTSKKKNSLSLFHTHLDNFKTGQFFLRFSLPSTDS